jgi:hypothetical protein
MKTIVLSVFALVAFGPRVASAAQVLIFDQEYSHLADNSARNNPIKSGAAGLKGSHAYFLPAADRPKNWVSPVNYRDGKMHVIIDVLAKPGKNPVRLSYCMENPGAACVGQVTIDRVGRFEIDQKPGGFFTGYGPDYTKGFNWCAIVLRDTGAAEGKKLDLGQGFMGEPNYALYVPLTMRVRAYLVSQGSTFQSADSPDAGTPKADGGDETPELPSAPPAPSPSPPPTRAAEPDPEPEGDESDDSITQVSSGCSAARSSSTAGGLGLILLALLSLRRGQKTKVACTNAPLSARSAPKGRGEGPPNAS